MSMHRFLPQNTKFDFIGARWYAFVFTAVLILGSFAMVAFKGLNFGIDFSGGILIETRLKEGQVDIAAMRGKLGSLGLGEVALQNFGNAGDSVLIRIQRQEGGEKEQIVAVNKVKESLGEGFEYRRVEFVGPKVGEELVKSGVWAVVWAIIAIAVYVWFRFEWQFGVGAMISTFHDVITIFGLFAVFGLEFNMTSVAGILTLAGYSINDTVVIYDRVRENLRKYKTMSLKDLLNLSVNETLARTILTGSTVLLSALALFLFGGEVLEGFSLIMIWGVIIGSFSSVYVAIPVLIYFDLRANAVAKEEEVEQP